MTDARTQGNALHRYARLQGANQWKDWGDVTLEEAARKHAAFVYAGDSPLTVQVKDGELGGVREFVVRREVRYLAGGLRGNAD